MKISTWFAGTWYHKNAEYKAATIGISVPRGDVIVTYKNDQGGTVELILGAEELEQINQMKKAWGEKNATTI